MRLFRVVVPLLAAGILPCVAQSPAPIQPVASAPSKTQNSSRLNTRTRTVKKKDSACYSIRDYEFATPKGAKFPMLKSYSTCEPAVRFEARNVMKRH